MRLSDLEPERYVTWFRQSAPYINAHRGRTFVLACPGEALADAAALDGLVHDLALLNSLGTRLIVVFGVRPQVEARLAARGLSDRLHHGRRVTDEAALGCVQEAAAEARVALEARLSMGLANSPMAGLRIRVASGNHVIARPLGVVDGVDMAHTGEVRRIDTPAIRERLGAGEVVLVAPLGYSPTGEVFNLVAEDLAVAVAAELAADKLLLLTDGEEVRDAAGALVHELTLAEAQRYTGTPPEGAGAGAVRHLEAAIRACHAGVRRVHLIDRHHDGGLLLELFTRDGVGTLVTAERFEATRPATVDDVGGVLALIRPLEDDGSLVRRSRERLEQELDHFLVVERDGAIVATAALLPLEGGEAAELACFAVHPDYQGGGRGDALLAELERRAERRGLARLFVLTTRTEHWFRERGFAPSSLDELPVHRQALYNYQRNSKVFVKRLGR